MKLYCTILLSLLPSVLAAGESCEYWDQSWGVC